ncbi:MAG TPA: carbon storage regulator [Pirellulales bacterium]|nr:carbon storage regulator [Pirellulales bacterium]
MLVLSRKIGERILIGEEISITVVRVGQGGVRLGIVAPNGMTVMREELRLPDVGAARNGTDSISGPVEIRS